MSASDSKKGGRPKLTFKTPGQECQHADKGMCNGCRYPSSGGRSFDSHFRQPVRTIPTPKQTT